MALWDRMDRKVTSWTVRDIAVWTRCGIKGDRTYIVITIFSKKGYPLTRQRAARDQSRQLVFGKGNIVQQASIAECTV